MVAIIENTSERLEFAKTAYPGTSLFSNYQDFLKEKIQADIVAVATQDDDYVVDYQVTIMQFAKGKTACHTMTAFSREIYRDLKIHGTKAELVGVIENNSIEIRYFGGAVEKITVDISEANVCGYMGGDYFMMNSLFKALNGEKTDGITYLDVSIESHLMSFAAEDSRLNNGVPILIKK